MVILNCCFYQINAALVSIRDLIFQNHTDPNLLKSSVSVSTCRYGLLYQMFGRVTFSPWRRWQTASESIRFSTTRSSPSSTSTWRLWRLTVLLWSMFAVSSLLYISLWPPHVKESLFDFQLSYFFLWCDIGLKRSVQGLRAFKIASALFKQETNLQSRHMVKQTQ